MIKVIDNFFTTEEQVTFASIVEQEENWKFIGYSDNPNSVNYRNFWEKNLNDTKAVSLFTNKIQRCINYKIRIDDLYINGQAHGQCGDWHTDVRPGNNNCFTVIYFNKELLP